ncbi:hypothetical protein V8C35DRAFT_217463 [Trichoderma chlorosporum]
MLNSSILCSLVKMLYRLGIEFSSSTTMEFPRIIAPGDVHPTRIENLQPKVDNNLDKATFDLRNSIVRLQFDFGQETKHGTGFFVNFPSDKYDVILTAAHNLMNEDKIRALNLMVVYGSEDFDLVMDFKICPEYEQNPKFTNRGSFDYGIILLLKDNTKQNKRQGLGLNLGLSSHPTLRGSKGTRVSGYKAEDPNHPLQHSSGQTMRGGKQYLEYKAPTEQGMSGSPVWVPYGGLPMVVGIHNTRPDQNKKNAGSTGTKITEEVFRHICAWSEIGFFGKRLCAVGGKGKSHNTYLSFYQNSNFAKVFLGSPDEASNQDNVTFDIMPAIVLPKWVEAERTTVFYAFKFHRPSWGDEKKCWVEWQPAQQRAILVESIKDVNLVRLDEKLLKGGKKRFVVIIPVPVGASKVQELRLYDDDRDEDDIEDGMTEFAGVSFGGLGVKAGMVGSRLLVIE